MASFSVALILLPNDAIDYGTAGVAIIISKLTGLQLSLCMIAVFLPFLIAGYIGRESKVIHLKPGRSDGESKAESLSGFDLQSPPAELLPLSIAII